MLPSNGEPAVFDCSDLQARWAGDNLLPTLIPTHQGRPHMHATDLDLTGKDIGELTSPDAFSAFLTRLGYRTTARTHLTPESIGLAGDSAAAFKNIELLSENDEQF